MASLRTQNPLLARWSRSACVLCALTLIGGAVGGEAAGRWVVNMLPASLVMTGLAVLLVLRPLALGRLSSAARGYLRFAGLALALLLVEQLLQPSALPIGWWPIALQAMSLGVVAATAASRPGGGLNRVALAVAPFLVLLFGIGLAGDASFYRSQFLWSGINVNIVTNVLGSVLLGGGLLAWLQRNQPDRPPHWQSALLLCGVLALLATAALSGRRGFWWAAGCGTLFACWLHLQQHGKRLWLQWLLLGALIVGATGGVLYGSGLLPLGFGSDILRPLVYHAAWDAFCAHPWTGVGAAGAFQMQTLDIDSVRSLTAANQIVSHAHSSVLDAAVSGGIPFLLLLAGQTCFVGKALWRITDLPTRVAYGFTLVMLVLLSSTDASFGTVLGFLIPSLLIGGLLAEGDPQNVSEERPRDLLLVSCCLVGAVGATAVAQGAFAVAVLAKDDTLGHFTRALTRVTNAAHVIPLTRRIADQAAGEAQPQIGALALQTSIQRAGRLGLPLELTTDLALHGHGDPAELLNLLALSLQQSSFSEARYQQLAAVMRVHPTIAVDERLANRAHWLAHEAEPPEQILVRVPHTLDDAADLWCATLSLTGRKPPAESTAALHALFQQWSFVPGVATAAFTLCARMPDLSAQAVMAEAPHLAWALSNQGDLVHRLNSVTTTAEAQRALPLVDRFYPSTARYPQVLGDALERVRTLARSGP